MSKTDKWIRALSAESKRKAEEIMDRLEKGADYRTFLGRKLSTPWTSTGWVTIPLKRRERMIVSIDKSLGCQLFFAGPHEEYNHIVGGRKRRMLR